MTILVILSEIHLKPLDRFIQSPRGGGICFPFVIAALNKLMDFSRQNGSNYPSAKMTLYQLAEFAPKCYGFDPKFRAQRNVE